MEVEHEWKFVCDLKSAKSFTIEFRIRIFLNDFCTCFHFLIANNKLK